jgi:magnesium transporter
VLLRANCASAVGRARRRLVVVQREHVVSVGRDARSSRNARARLASEEGCSVVETAGATTSARPSAPWPSPTCSKSCSRDAARNIAAGTDGRSGRGVPARRQLVALAAEPRLGAQHARPPPPHFQKTQGIEDALIQPLLRPRHPPIAAGRARRTLTVWSAGGGEATNRLAGVIVGRAIYREGKRVVEPQDFAEMAAACRNGDGIAWIGLYRPTHEEFADVTREFALHELAVEDAVGAHQRAKLEYYSETLFCVLHPARYIDETETVEFGEVHVFAGPQFVITVRHGQTPDLAAVRRGLEARPDLLRRGPLAILHAIIDRVVDDYAPVVAGVENDIDEIEDEMFGVGDRAHVSRRIYQLTREVIAFQRAIKPLVAMLERLIAAPGVEDEEGRYLRDVHDHALRVQEQADGFRELLQNILSINLTLETKTLSEVSNKQNDQVKKISAWAAILFAPSMVGTVYGMNFDHMPELDWQHGYPFALGLMGAVSLALYLLFKRRHWI